MADNVMFISLRNCQTILLNMTQLPRIMLPLILITEANISTFFNIYISCNHHLV